VRFVLLFVRTPARSSCAYLHSACCYHPSVTCPAVPLVAFLLSLLMGAGCSVYHCLRTAVTQNIRWPSTCSFLRYARRFVVRAYLPPYLALRNAHASARTSAALLRFCGSGLGLDCLAWTLAVLPTLEVGRRDAAFVVRCPACTAVVRVSILTPRRHLFPFPSTPPASVLLYFCRSLL